MRWNTEKPDGQPRRCLDVTRAEQMLGWKARTSFDEGLRRTVAWYRAHGQVAAPAGDGQPGERRSTAK